MKAAIGGFTHIAKALLDAGANTDLQDKVQLYFLHKFPTQQCLVHSVYILQVAPIDVVGMHWVGFTHLPLMEYSVNSRSPNYKQLYVHACGELCSSLCVCGELLH